MKSKFTSLFLLLQQTVHHLTQEYTEEKSPYGNGLKKTITWTIRLHNLTEIALRNVLYFFRSAYKNLEISEHAKIYQFPKVAGAVKIDDLTLNNDKKYLMKAVKLVSKGSIECTSEELRTVGEYKV